MRDLTRDANYLRDPFSLFASVGATKSTPRSSHDGKSWTVIRTSHFILSRVRL